MVSVQLTLQIAGRDVLIERSKAESFARVSWIEDDGDPISLQIRVKGDGPVVYGEDVVNLSDLIFRLLGYPIIRVRKRTGDDDSPMVRLSFRDLLKFCYLEQEVLDSSFFRLSQPILSGTTMFVYCSTWRHPWTNTSAPVEFSKRRPRGFLGRGRRSLRPG